MRNKVFSRQCIKGYAAALFKILSGVRAYDRSGAKVNLDGSLCTVIKEIAAKKRTESKVIIIGNGGSAAIANHMAVDLWRNAQVKAVSFSDASLLTCVSNDFGYEYVFAKPVEMFAGPGDLLIAISSSGKSKNILNAADSARRKGCRVITMSGFKAGNQLCSKGQINFYVPSGSYGYVEIAHSALCHFITDEVIRHG